MMIRRRPNPGWILAAAALSIVSALAAEPSERTEHPRERGWAADPGTTVRNEFGPLLSNGAAACRGACGPDCPSTCEQDVYWECVDESRFRVVRTYTCGTDEGCREHDDCLDACSVWDEDAVRMPQDLWEDHQDFFDDLWGETPVQNPITRNFVVGECSWYCHAKGMVEEIPQHGLRAFPWAVGHGPFDDEPIVFEYTVDAPGQEEPLYRCPDGMRMVCEEGRARCEEGDEPEDDTDEPPVTPSVGVRIDPVGICNDPAEPVEMSAAVVGTQSPRVSWSVVSGPGSIDPVSGRLTASGEGTVTVKAVSVSDPLFSDEASVQFEDCTCFFHATLSGDVSRTVIEGEFALWSRPGEDAANVAGPLLQSLEALGIEDATGLDADAADEAIAKMRREGALFILKLVEGGEDVNSFNLTTYPQEEMGGEAGIMALIDGLQFIGPGELDIHSSDKGWIEGVLRAETGPEGGVALRDGRGPPTQGIPTPDVCRVPSRQPLPGCVLQTTG